MDGRVARRWHGDRRDIDARTARRTHSGSARATRRPTSAVRREARSSRPRSTGIDPPSRRMARDGRYRLAAGRPGKCLHTASRAGASIEFAFNGRAVALVAPKGTSAAARPGLRGWCIRLDGQPESGDRPVAGRGLRAFLATTASHTVKLVVDGTAGHPRVDVDGSSSSARALARRSRGGQLPR